MKLLRLTPALKATSAPYNQFSLGLKDTIEQTIFSFHSYEDIKIDKDSRYINLGDWIDHYSYAEFDGDELKLKYWDI